MIYRFIALNFALFLFHHLASAQNFPSDFIGTWQGELQWFQQGKPTPQKVNMQLAIQPTGMAGVYEWKLVYGDGGRDTRPYLLKQQDSAGIHWIIDEQNGILLDHYWFAGRFQGSFSVMQSTITNSFYIQGDSLVVEFISTSSEAVRTSGGEEKDIPLVRSYRVKSYQKAVLRKKKS